ncbi:MAG: hypothetical protein O2832_02265 [Proteobacteria bacterium]|nr:hypothetical protein [Pseudomonadota bacterium]
MSVQDIADFVHSDTRSKEEIFESLKAKIQAYYDNKLSEEEAIQATRNFIGLFQMASEIYDEKQ